MDLYKRQQFEFLLQTAVERLAERLERRHRGPDVALRHLLSSSSESEVAEFVDAVFADFLLDNIEGACFILQSLPQKRLGQVVLNSEQTIQSTLIQIAKIHFTQLLQAKTLEALEQHSGYQPVDIGDDRA